MWEKIPKFWRILKPYFTEWWAKELASVPHRDNYYERDLRYNAKVFGSCG